MIILFYIILGIIATILAIGVYILVIYPIIRFSEMRRKYGDKIKVYFSIGKGIFNFYQQDLIKKNDSLAFIRSMHHENLKAFAFNYGTKVGLSFVEPEHQRQLFQNIHSFSKADGPIAITFLFGHSIAFAPEKEWRRQRQFLSKSFHFEEIKNYLPLIKQSCEKIVKKLDTKLLQNDQIEVKVVGISQEVTSEISYKIFFGSASENQMKITKKDGTQIPISEEIVQIIIDSFTLLKTDKLALIKWILLKRNSVNYFPTKGEKEILIRLQALKQVQIDVVTKRNEELIKDPSQAKKNFLDQYLIEMIQDKNSGITYDEIISNFAAIYFAGTDTSGNMVGVALYYLSRFPEIQQQARAEIIKVLSSKKEIMKTEFSQLEFEDIQNLNFIHCILKESLRIMGPSISSQIKQADHNIKIGEFDIKKGDLVTAHYFYNHTNPSVFENPDDFKPERWLDSNNLKQQSNFSPFSQGPRSCIGQHLAIIEGKCLLASILLQFEIIPNTSQQVIRELKSIYTFQNDNLVFFKKIKQINQKTEMMI
nr:cytochrome P450 monooxygenase CYP5005A19 [Tetrahymena thermophila]